MTKKMPLSILSILLAAGLAGAQEKTERPKRTPTPVKLQVVYSRYQGEKKVSSLPYVLSFNTDDRPARLRMGVMVPIQTVVNSTPTMTYKDVGNNIDCNAESVDDGRFKLACSFEQSSLTSVDAERNSGAATSGIPLTPLAPLIRTFRTEANLILRDGQTVQYTAATDPVTGEVLKIDVTLNVVR